MNSAVIDKILEILPTLYLNKISINHEDFLFKSKEMIKHLNNTEKIKLYETNLETQESQDIIELCVLLNNIWEKDYQYNKQDLKQKREFIEIYLKDVIKPFNLNLVFEILDNIKTETNYFGKYEIIRDIITDILNLEMLSLDIIDKLIIYAHRSNTNNNISKFILSKCKSDIFKVKDSIVTSYAKEIAINSEKQLKLIVLNHDFLSNHIKTRTNILKNSSYF